MDRREFLDKHFEVIKKLYPGAKVVYGPYYNKKDGRYRICIYNGTSRKTKQFCRLKMEVKLKRILTENETVDHNDGDITNDRYSNLVVRERVEHAQLDVKRRDNNLKGICVWCSRSFTLTINQIREDGRKNIKAGPFCSRGCSGKYGASVQGGGKSLDRTKSPVIYYTNKKKK